MFKVTTFQNLAKRNPPSAAAVTRANMFPGNVRKKEGIFAAQHYADPRPTARFVAKRIYPTAFADGDGLDTHNRRSRPAHGAAIRAHSARGRGRRLERGMQPGFARDGGRVGWFLNSDQDMAPSLANQQAPLSHLS